MNDAVVSESTVESAALAWLARRGWAVTHSTDIGPDAATPERGDYGAVALETRLRAALAEFNSSLPGEALDETARRLTRPTGATRRTPPSSC